VALVEDVLLEALVDLEISPGRVWREGQVALGGGTGGQHVFAGAGPDIADDVVDREAEARGGLYRDRRGHTPGAQEHPVRVGLTHLPPLRGLFVAGIGHRNLDIFEAVLFRQQLQRAEGFATIGRVVVDRGDLLALEFVEAAFALGDVVHQRRCLAVEGQHHREVVREHGAVSGFGAAVAEGDQRDLVDLRALAQRIRRWRAVRLVDRDRRAIQAILEALIALDALLRRPLGFALLPHQLYAIDAAFDLVDITQIVDHPGPHLHTAGGVGAHAIGGQGNELLVRRGRRLGDRTGQGCQRKRGADQGTFQGCTHGGSLSVSKINSQSKRLRNAAATAAHGHAGCATGESNPRVP